MVQCGMPWQKHPPTPPKTAGGAPPERWSPPPHAHSRFYFFHKKAYNMRPFILAAILAPLAAHATTIQVCDGEFALCAASPTTAVPGQTINVNGVTFALGTSVCPVLKGPAFADMDLMSNSCAKPAPGKVWSLFQPRKQFPQAPTWATQPSAFRKFTTTATPTGGMSNMFSFPCTVRPNKINGTKLADCYGPMNESLTGIAVAPGTEVMTQSPEGAANPVGGPTP